MFDHVSLIMFLGLLALAAPLLLVCVLGVSSLVGWKLSEAVVGKSSQAAVAFTSSKLRWTATISQMSGRRPGRDGGRPGLL